MIKFGFEVEFEGLEWYRKPEPEPKIYMPPTVRDHGYYHIFRDALSEAKEVRKIILKQREQMLCRVPYPKCITGLPIIAPWKGKAVTIDVEALAITGSCKRLVVANGVYDTMHSTFLSRLTRRPQVGKYTLLDLDNDKEWSLVGTGDNPMQYLDTWNRMQPLSRQNDWIYLVIPTDGKREWG